MKGEITKGGKAEELLRGYFLMKGFFTLRSVKFNFRRNEITDVDIFLYFSHSSLLKERVNVDIKNKRTPQAMERILWAKGLQSALSLNRTVVVTTDNRPDVLDFGQLNRVNILNGRFLERLTLEHLNTRLSEEEFIEEIKKAADQATGKVNQLKEYEQAKSILLQKPDFNGCNELLDRTKHYFELYRMTDKETIYLRLFYMGLSLFLINLDFALRHHENDNQSELFDFLSTAFLFGSGGKERTENLIAVLNAFGDSEPKYKGLVKSVEGQFRTQATSDQFKALSEFLSQRQTIDNLFSLAKQLEELSFAKNLPAPATLPPNVASLLAAILDHMGVERREFF